MKLANKYELFDPVTTGKVETFVARDLATGERVLVHVFEGGPSPSDPPTSEWALEAFAGMAPTPPAAVIDVGRYAGTDFAYLVTQVPEADVLQKWVAAYESHPQQTPEIQSPPPEVTATSPVPRSPTHPAVPEAGSITAVFSPPPKTADQTLPLPRPKPKEKDTKSVPAPVAAPERISTQRPGNFTSMFQSAGIPAESGSAGVRSNEGKGGEFTSFFRGPFTGKASETPNLAPPAPEPESRLGEFTQIFGGRAKPQESPAEPSLRSDAPLNEPGGFTQLFSAPPPVKEEKPVTAENPFVFDKPTWEPQIPTQPPMAAPPKNPFESMPAVLPPLPAGGPSEYTMIVSGGRAPSAPDEPPIAGGTNPPGAKPAAAFAMPKAPAMPAVPVPKMPAAPQMPHVPAPPVPGLEPPKAPKLPDAPKPPTSLLPLILTFTVLFFVAAMLVLYFALKH